MRTRLPASAGTRSVPIRFFQQRFISPGLGRNCFNSPTCSQWHRSHPDPWLHQGLLLARHRLAHRLATRLAAGVLTRCRLQRPLRAGRETIFGKIIILEPITAEAAALTERGFIRFLFVRRSALWRGVLHKNSNVRHHRRGRMEQKPVNPLYILGWVLGYVIWIP